MDPTYPGVREAEVEETLGLGYSDHRIVRLDIAIGNDRILNKTLVSDNRRGLRDNRSGRKLLEIRQHRRCGKYLRKY